MTTSVLLADDHAAIRAGLRAIIDNTADLSVVGEAGDGRAALTQARALRPDVVCMDIRMPGMDGIEATRAITSEGTAGVLILTTFDIDDYVFGALRAGAAGFLLKTTDAATLTDAIRTVAQGDGILAPEVTLRVLSAFAATRAPNPDGADVSAEVLTDRERDILRCLGEGLSNHQIASRLAIAETTVKTHVSRVLAKLGLQSRVQAAIYCREHGLA